VLFNPLISIPETSIAGRRRPNPSAPRGLPDTNLLASSISHIKWSQSSGLKKLAILPPPFICLPGQSIASMTYTERRRHCSL
jgi:hypothetical protein